MQKLYKINIEGDEYTVGYPASVLVGQLEEELETLRASNRIKQANIELLEAENAKLIAERDDIEANSENWKYYQNLLKMNGFSGITDLLAKYRSIERERDALLAEREAMTKQEPHPIGEILSHCGYLTHDQAMDLEDEIGLVYRWTLPAQQIPEGYALVPDVANNEMISAGLDTLMRSLGRLSNYRQTVSNIWEDMLSASQPKGDM